MNIFLNYSNNLAIILKKLIQAHQELVKELLFNDSSSLHGIYSSLKFPDLCNHIYILFGSDEDLQYSPQELDQVQAHLLHLRNEFIMHLYRYLFVLIEICL